MKQIIPKQTSALAAGISILAALALVVLFASVSPRAEAAAGTAITFSDSAVTASGETGGVETDGTDLTITKAGTYTLTGTCADGSVTVKKGTEGVTLVLDGLNLTSKDSAALSVNKESRVTLEITGTNVLTDAEDIANEEAEDFDGAAVKVKSGASLTVTGDGTLTVSGECKNGIKGAGLSTITVESGTLIVNAEDKGISSENAIVVSGGSLTVTAAEDGIKAEPDEDDTESAGSITISGGTFDITSGDDAFKSSGDLTVTGGTFKIAAGDDGMSADYVLTIGTKGSSSGPDITVTKCTEGLEGAAVNLYSGKAVVTSDDDGINAANGDLSNYDHAINVTGGSWYVNAGGDAMDSNGDINISGGTVELFGSPNNGNNALDYQGACTVSGGTLFTVDCTGMNQVPSYGTYVVFGKTAGMGFGGGQMPRMGQDGQPPELPEGMTPPAGSTPPEPPDGAEQSQNGQRPQRGQDGQRPEMAEGMTPPDFNAENADGQNQMRGGGMGGQTVDTSTISIQSGSKIEVRDSSGKTLYSAAGTKTANCVMLSSQDLKSGETYTLYVDGEAVATADAQEGSGQGGFNPGGQQNSRPDRQNGQQGQGQQPDQSKTSTGYADVADTAWYKDAVSYVTDKKMMNGTGDSRFSPEGSATRAMVVTILYRLEGSPEAGTSSYSDVATDVWYADAVAWAEANGIVNGTGNGTFSPERSVTRQQLAAILYRYARYRDLDVSSAGDLSGFTDQGQVQSYAKDAMEWACGVKLIQGMDNNRLQPDGGATRAQVATILQRLCETVMK